MERFDPITFPVVLGLRNTHTIEQIFRRNTERFHNEGFKEGKYVSVLEDDGHHTETDGVVGVRELTSNIATNVSITLFGYTFFTKIHRPILLVSKSVTEHRDIDTPGLRRKELLNSIRSQGDALSILVPLKKETVGSNTFKVEDGEFQIDWMTSPHTAIVFDQTKLHGIDGDELKMYWSALVHRKFYDRIRLFAEKMDKIMKKI